MQRVAYSVLAGLVLGSLFGDLFAADMITGTVYSEGITGRPGMRAKGWFEESVFVNHKGNSGTGSGDLSGGWHSWQRGLFEINLPDSQQFPASQYGLFTLGYDEVPGFDYVLDVDVPGGAGSFTQDIYVRADYSVQYDDSWTEWPGNSLDERWVWGNNFYQTFVASSLHITRLASRLVARDDAVQNIGLQLLKVNAGPPSSWTPVLPVRQKYVGDHGNDVLGLFIRSVTYHSDEATIIPGDTYALRIFCLDGTGSGYQFGIFARPDSGDGYANGHLWSDDTPLTGWDAYGYVTGGGDNNTLINYAPIADFQTADFIGFSNQWGQTFRATGEGLAAVEATLAFIDGSQDHYPITFQLYQSVGGAPIGPPKTTHTLRVHAYLWRAGAFWHPFETSLTPGQTYYIEAVIPDGCNVWNMNEGYANGDAYLNRARQAGRDVLMSIAEYEDMSKFGQVTPTPTPAGGVNLLINGDMEIGFQGTDGHTPDNWEKWLGNGSPSYWYGDDYGYTGAGARLIGGAINGTTFDAGLYQRVIGLTPGQQYQFTGWAMAAPQNAGDYRAWIGVDLTGQTSEGTAGTVTYWQTGGAWTWEQLPPQTLIATGSSMTVFLRASNTSTAETFYADFDEISLVKVGPSITFTPTPTGPQQPTPTHTPAVGGNLLANWSFEASEGTSHPGWTNNSGFITNGDYPNPHSAYDRTKWVSRSYGDGGSVVYDLYQTVAVLPGHTYELAAWCYMGGGFGGHGIARLVWNDGGYPGTSGGTPLASMAWDDGDPEINWTEMSGEAVPGSSSLSFILRAEMSGWGAGMNFDACSLIDQGGSETPTPVPTATETPVPAGGLPGFIVY
jgi:hypothetical protein